MYMKLNNYQRIMLVWAGLVSVGYVASIWLFESMVAFFAIWFVVGVVGVAVEYKLGGTKDKKAKLSQIVWAIIVLGGIFLNIFERTGTIPLFGDNMFIGWPLACSFGMLVTALIYRLNVSYLILMVGYIGFAVMMYFVVKGFNTSLFVSALLFAALLLVDAGFEGTPFRKRNLLAQKQHLEK